MTISQLRAGMQHEIDFHILRTADMREHDPRAAGLLEELGLEPLTELSDTAPAWPRVVAWVQRAPDGRTGETYSQAQRATE